MSELRVVEPVEVLVPLDEQAARKLDGRIRRLAKQAGDQLVLVGQLLDEAKVGRIHEALGFPSWTAYVADSLGGTLQLSGAARQAMVELMAGEGMSVRAIATATGVSKSTVDRDLAQLSRDGTVDAESTVPQRDSSPHPGVGIGLDGKVRRKPRQARRRREQEPSSTQSAARKVPVQSMYRRTVKALNPVVCELGSLVDDPRWVKARERFTEKDRAEVHGNIAVLQKVLAAMDATAVASVDGGDSTAKTVL
ncbi:winged helix-turn-helix transcriptional regulator [Mycobacterium barrassiae]|uniref:winged helix-turn-helix domain-containing protein n=1 Tax=Mycobacterium barrassiae TaxID=319709 RepID=UPI002265D648|nr:winged helix-turn-helix domain-containing protein [Mycobacterium barrassiae]MCV7300866.1 winged helix-turn-helix transcriptional regulator [Mycobacterium barrassiae]